MSLATGTIFNIQATATTANVNGAGFNPLNAAFPTDLTTDTNTANTSSPIVSSATYNFAAGDVGAYLFIKSGTNWTPGFYKIASVAANKATLTASIGTAIQANSITGIFDTANTVVGCATVGTPTVGTYGINYAWLDTAPISAVADFNAVGASVTLTSVTAGFTPVMVGNFFHQTTTGTGAFGIVGWYEIATYVNATTVTLDRTPNSGTASVNTTGYVGGAGRLNALEDAFFEMIPTASTVWMKSGTYTIALGFNIASTNSTPAQPSNIIGYTSMWGDACNGSNRPVINGAALGMTFGSAQNLINLSFTTTTAAGVTLAANEYVQNCKCINTSTTAGRGAILLTTNNTLSGCEFISQNGSAVSSTSGVGIKIFNCYMHDSQTGFANATATADTPLVGNVFASCDTQCLNYTSTSAKTIIGNTFYGREAKIGIGINFNNAALPSNRVFSNILYGFTTGINVLTTQQDSNISAYNDFYNNTADTALFNKSNLDLAVNPQFVGATQITGTTATTSGSVLTQSGGDFSTITDNDSYLHVISGTGVTTGIYQITSHTGTTATVNNALGTSSGGDVVYYISTGHNFTIGNAAIKGTGYPNFIALGLGFTSYPDVGGVQAQTSGGSTGSSFTYGG